MGFAGISPGSLLLILLIVVLIYGGRRLRDLGEDLGVAVKNFRQALNSESENKDPDKIN